VVWGGGVDVVWGGGGSCVVVAKGIGSDVVFGLAAAKYCAVVVGSMVVLSTVVVTKTVSTTTSVTVSQTTSRFCKGAATANEARRPATTVRVWRICGAMAKESSEILMLSKQWRERNRVFVKRYRVFARLVKIWSTIRELALKKPTSGRVMFSDSGGQGA